MRGSIIIFTLGWPAAWGGGLGAHTLPSTRQLGCWWGGKTALVDLVPWCPVILHREYVRVSFPAPS